MDLTSIKFLLDENIPIKLTNFFKKFKIKSMTIQELGWSGYKDKEIITKIINKNCIFVTRDKDFTFLWRNSNLKVIYLAIQPAILDFILPRMEYLLNNWDYNLDNPFLKNLSESIDQIMELNIIPALTSKHKFNAINFEKCISIGIGLTIQVLKSKLERL